MDLSFSDLFDKKIKVNKKLEKLLISLYSLNVACHFFYFSRKKLVIFFRVL